MAKKGKKGKSGSRIPKEIAGTKLPKALRTQAKTLLKVMDGPAARELLVAGLAAAATALAPRTTARRGASEAAPPRAADRDRRRSKDHDGAELGAILKAVAAEGARRLLDHFEQGREASAVTGDATDGKPRRRPAKRPAKRPARAEPAAGS